MNPTILVTWTSVNGMWRGDAHAVGKSTKIRLFGKPPQGFQGGAWMCRLVSSRRYHFLASQGILEAKLIRPCKGQRPKHEIDRAAGEAKEALKCLPRFTRGVHKTANGYIVHTEVSGAKNELVRTWKISFDEAGTLVFQRLDKTVLSTGILQRSDGQFEVTNLDQAIKGMGNPAITRNQENNLVAEWKDEAGNALQAHVPEEELLRLAQTVELKSIDRVDGISVYGTLLLDGAFEIQTRLCQGEWTFERNKVRPAKFESVASRLSSAERSRLVSFLREKDLIQSLKGYQDEEVRDAFNRLVGIMGIVRRSMDVENPNRFALERMRKKLMDGNSRFMDVLQNQMEYAYSGETDPEIYGHAMNHPGYAHYAPLVTMVYQPGLESLEALIEQLRKKANKKEQLENYTPFAAAAE